MFLLDTHVLVWLVEGSDRLGPRAARLADAALTDGELAVASISFWEIAMLATRRRIVLDVPPLQWRLHVLGLGVQEVPLSGDVAMEAAALGNLHQDPADRIIVATGLSAGAILATADNRILGWRGSLRCHDARR
ncbi:MAG: type II toxin-antitoxin system VapC family toxin [Candidatus Rokuibacteriota bacterium]